MPTLDIENEKKTQGYRAICGVDEAGRGPLIGDVYAAAVIIGGGEDGATPWWSEINDSKKISEKKREKLFDIICENALAYGIASATPKEIDELNIRNASFLAMSRAIENLKIKADFVLIDGNAFEPKIGGNDIPFECIIKGDTKSISIAAASILAKVARDRTMRELDERYPKYGFAQHKGYPTAAHYAAISEFGVLAEHRKSFRLM
ncbi:ribonuclease HII [Clostridia bacterium]|nr:ribonuclease HII [Clostridia bacterium]